MPGSLSEANIAHGDLSMLAEGDEAAGAFCLNPIGLRYQDREPMAHR
jgi:hypothetical protein